MVYLCPECKAEVNAVYRDKYGEVVGCECCITSVDVYSVLDSEEDKAADDHGDCLYECTKDERYGYA